MKQKYQIDWIPIESGGFVPNKSYLIAINATELGFRTVDIGRYEYDAAGDEWFWNFVMCPACEFEVTHFAEMPELPPQPAGRLI